MPGHQAPDERHADDAGTAERFGSFVGRSAAGLAREIVSTAGVAVSVPLCLAALTLAGPGANETTPDDPDDDPPVVPAAMDPVAAPVVLVHGFAGSQVSWFALRRALRAAGRTVVTFDYAPWGASVDELADRLVETVEELLAVTGAARVHLVGHSLGGVIIAQALTRKRMAGRVDVVVTMGAPFGGSPWAAVVRLGPLVRALRTDSPLLRALAEAPAPAGVRWLVFTGRSDVVVPARRAVPVRRIVTRVDVDAAGHCGIVAHPEVISRIVAATAPATPPVTAPVAELAARAA